MGDELVEAFKKNKAFLIPTLVVCSSLTGDEQELRDRFAAKATPQQLTANVKETMCQCLGLGVPGATVKHSYESIKKLKAAGIDIVAVSRPAPSFSGEMQTDRSQGNGLRAADEGNSYR